MAVQYTCRAGSISPLPISISISISFTEGHFGVLIYTVSPNNVQSLTGHNFNTHSPIFYNFYLTFTRPHWGLQRSSRLPSWCEGGPSTRIPPPLSDSHCFFTNGTLKASIIRLWSILTTKKARAFVISDIWHRRFGGLPQFYPPPRLAPPRLLPVPKTPVTHCALFAWLYAVGLC